MPAGLSKEAQTIWHCHVDELFQLGLICALDAYTLAEYCESMADLQAMRRSLKQLRAKRKPIDKQLDQIDKLSKMVSRMGDAFGLTPKGRKAMGIETKHPPDSKNADPIEAKKHWILNGSSTKET